MYLSFRARGQIGATAASLHHSHSKLHLQPTPQLMAMPDPLPTEARDRTSVLMESSTICFCWAMMETLFLQAFKRPVIFLRTHGYTQRPWLVFYTLFLTQTWMLSKLYNCHHDSNTQLLKLVFENISVVRHFSFMLLLLNSCLPVCDSFTFLDPKELFS